MTLDDLRTYCLSLPGTTEIVQWGADLLFKVGEKTYVFAGLNPPHGISIKCNEEDFYALIEREGIKPAAYVGRFKWVSVPSLKHLPDRELRRLIRKSYDEVVAKLPKKVRASLSASATGPDSGEL
jgi:predicted DNA-binding protein (MmcQ/YjbR family)